MYEVSSKEFKRITKKLKLLGFGKKEESSHSIDKDRTRIGKTRKDKEKNRQQKSLENKLQRALWQKERKTLFPSHTCNGKKNRYQVTSKGNKTKVLK